MVNAQSRLRKVVRGFVVSVGVIVGVCLQTVHAAQTSTIEQKTVWQMVDEGSAIILMRHALAPGVGDPSEFALNRCETQRNLSDTGRNQAREIGNLLRKNGIKDADVLTSQWCRCIETAELLKFGEPVQLPIINSFFQDRSTEPMQTRSLKEQIEIWLNDTNNNARILVTHQVNISALTGQFANSGEMLFITIEDGQIAVLDQVQTQY